MPDDYSRKQYDDKSYPDWMRSMPAKAMWNQILESNPGVGEYHSKIRSTPLSRSIRRYIEQSNFKKPYLDNDFVNMEQSWEGPGRGTEYRPGTYDNPWNVRYPQISQADPVAGADMPKGPCYSVFDAESSSCWCNNQSMEIVVTGTHPINALTMTWFAVGTTLTVTDGLGTNTVTANLATTDNQSGYVTIEASMTAFCENGPVAGDSNVNIFECRDCCADDACDDFVVNTGTTPNTIAQDDSATIAVSGGTAPYTWSLSQADGEGFSIDASITNSTTLYTTVDACGSADLTVTDACNCEVQFSVKCTTGAWSAAQNGPEYCGGCAGPPYCADSRNSGWVSGTGFQKICTQAACKYQYTENVRSTLSTSHTEILKPDCEAARIARSCNGTECTAYGTGGMECDECVAHRDPIPDLCKGVPMAMQGNAATYQPDECQATSGGHWLYCLQCWASNLLSRKKWTC